MALEQLQAAEDFNIFRRIMTRKNIDLQLQSLELLVSKYGVLSPSLRSEGCDPGDTGEDDFLQVVIRYCGDCLVLDAPDDTRQKSATDRNTDCTLHPTALSETKSSPVLDEDNRSKKSDENMIPFKSNSSTWENKEECGQSNPLKILKKYPLNPTNTAQIPAHREKVDPISTTITQNTFSQYAFDPDCR